MRSEAERDWLEVQLIIERWGSLDRLERAAVQSADERLHLSVDAYYDRAASDEA